MYLGTFPGTFLSILLLVFVHQSYPSLLVFYRATGLSVSLLGELFGGKRKRKLSAFEANSEEVLDFVEGLLLEDG